MISKINNLIRNSIPALSNKWFEKRASMISATDFGTILGLSHNKTIQDLLEKKLYNFRSTDNKYTLHGKKFEPVAISILENKLDINIKEIGFTVSKETRYLGATPDGITIYNNEIHLIEIKCPFTRQIDGCVPYGYYTQIQLQLYVCQVSKCLFFECDFEEVTKERYDNLDESECKGFNQEYNSYWLLRNSNLVLVERDETFLNKYFGNLTAFHQELEVMNRNQRRISRKRNIIEVSNSQTYNKKRRVSPIQVQRNEFVLSNAHMKNYVIGSKCNVWLSMYGNKYYKDQKKENKFTKELLKRSKQCDKEYTDNLIIKCQDKNISFTLVPEYFKCDSYLYELTQKVINDGVEVIINPTLYDETENIYSNPSYIIKSRVFNVLFNENKNTVKFTRIDSNKYCVVNKVNKSIKFVNEGTNVSGDQKHLHYLYINKFDNHILNKMQKYTMNKTFIIGTKWRFTKDKVVHQGVGDTRIGVYVHDLAEDIHDIANYKKWMEDIYVNDDKFIFFNDKSFLPCYSKSENTDWTDFKKSLLEQVDDINLLYGVGRKKKSKFYNESIYSWKDTKLPELLNDEQKMREFKISKRDANIMKRIVEFNTSTTNALICPNDIRNEGNWLEEQNVEMYVDFETLNDFLGPENMIYLVGMYVRLPNNVFEYYSFFADKADKQSERKMMDTWIAKINEIKAEYNLDYEPKVFCWSKAELNFMKQYNDTQNTNVKINFVDLLELIKKEVILIKGNIYGFSIKDVVKYMYEHKMINRNYKLDCNSGDLSIISAIKYYRNNDQKEYVDLIKYNETDCVVMYDIISYFRRFYKQ